jgi:VanZ family protein
MLPLRHVRFWRLAGLVLLLTVLVFTLVPAVWFWDDRAGALTWLENSDKYLHGITFLVLAVWFSGQYRRPSYFRIALGLLLFGLLIEFCQFMVGYRTADWLDMAANSVGIILGIVIALAGMGGWSQRVEDWYAARQTGTGIG